MSCVARTKTRHTTRLEGLPERVRVVRPHHPLEGRSLELIGCRRRGGKLELTVVLPDGSRRVIPAGWTDVWGAARALSSAMRGPTR